MPEPNLTVATAGQDADALLLAAPAEAPGHGYELNQRLIARSEGWLYPALHRLERGGLVESEWSAGGGRRRRVYKLTRSGRRAVTTSREEWRTFSNAMRKALG